MSEAVMFWWLIVGHCLTDFPLQGDFLAKAKNQTAPFPGVPWATCLAAHAIISGGAVAFVTGSVILGLGEAFVHAWIDHGKNAGRFSFNEDQAAHVICKAVWTWAVAQAVPL